MNKANAGPENMKIMYYTQVVCAMKNNYINIPTAFKEMYFKEKVYIKKTHNKISQNWIKQQSLKKIPKSITITPLKKSAT